MFIMHKNKIIADIDFAKETCQIFDKNFLPLSLCGIETLSVSQQYYAFVNFFANRVPELSEHNAQVLDNHFSNPKYAHIQKAMKAAIFSGTSEQDCIWLKTQNNTKTWEDVDPKKHSIMERCTNKSVSTRLEPQNQLLAQNLSVSHGSAPHLWMIKDDTLYYYKRIGQESATKEISASKILDKTNIPHVQYDSISENTIRCKNAANEQYSIIPATILRKFCTNNDIDYNTLVCKLDKENYTKMQIIDFLLDNNDRTDNNYGFYVDADTNGIVGLHPLFDHDHCFSGDLSLMKETDSRQYDYQVRQIQKMMKNSNIKFIQQLNPSDFPNRKNYNDFMERALDIGIAERVPIKQNILEKITHKEPLTRIQIKQEFLDSDRNKIKELYQPKEMEYDIYSKSFFSVKDKLMELETEYYEVPETPQEDILIIKAREAVQQERETHPESKEKEIFNRMEDYESR